MSRERERVRKRKSETTIITTTRIIFVDQSYDHNYSGVFGIRKYGVHVNGYVIEDDGTWRMWIGQRSKTKQTFPGMFDNMVSKRT
jgi:hypothetical protein